MQDAIKSFKLTADGQPPFKIDFGDGKEAVDTRPPRGAKEAPASISENKAGVQDKGAQSKGLEDNQPGVKSSDSSPAHPPHMLFGRAEQTINAGQDKQSGQSEKFAAPKIEIPSFKTENHKISVTEQPTVNKLDRQASPPEHPDRGKQAQPNEQQVDDSRDKQTKPNEQQQKVNRDNLAALAEQKLMAHDDVTKAGQPEKLSANLDDNLSAPEKELGRAGDKESFLTNLSNGLQKLENNARFAGLVAEDLPEIMKKAADAFGGTFSKSEGYQSMAATMHNVEEVDSAFARTPAARELSRWMHEDGHEEVCDEIKAAASGNEVAMAKVGVWALEHPEEAKELLDIMGDATKTATDAGKAGAEAFGTSIAKTFQSPQFRQNLSEVLVTLAKSPFQAAEQMGEGISDLAAWAIEHPVQIAELSSPITAPKFMQWAVQHPEEMKPLLGALDAVKSIAINLIPGVKTLNKFEKAPEIAHEIEAIMAQDGSEAKKEEADKAKRELVNTFGAIMAGKALEEGPKVIKNWGKDDAGGAAVTPKETEDPDAKSGAPKTGEAEEGKTPTRPARPEESDDDDGPKAKSVEGGKGKEAGEKGEGTKEEDPSKKIGHYAHKIVEKTVKEDGKEDAKEQADAGSSEHNRDTATDTNKSEGRENIHHEPGLDSSRRPYEANAPITRAPEAVPHLSPNETQKLLAGLQKNPQLMRDIMNQYPELFESS